MWDTALKMIAERKIPLRKQTDSMVETDWVDWVSEDEDVTIGSRYLMSMVETNNRYGIKISLIGWREMVKCKRSVPPIKSVTTPL